ncbi:MAG TPA: acyl-CoA dehydrogenase family protein [Acidimicrobiia bacterium]|jgi:alkylation response protein AidB-like acyl-CoA dehydrogenase
MDLDAFRDKAASWLDQHADDFPADPRDPRGTELRIGLWDAGLLGITLDEQYGGQGLTDEHQKVFNEEARRRGVVVPSDSVTVGICAPTLLDFGNKEQITRHVPAMIRGEEAWTQLLSEPGAGSDLAGLQTRAVRDGDEYVINGQKVWTSGAMQSAYALCIARTNADVPKHAGLSMFIVPLGDHPGVTIRPLKQMNGESHFNEVFLDDVRVPTENLVGAENEGWKALTAMLTHERLALGAGTGAGGGSGQGWTGASTDRFIAMARDLGVADEPVVRQEIVSVWILERTLALMGQKMRDEIAAGINVGSRGSVAKLGSAILSKRAAGLGVALGGAAAMAWEPGDTEGAALATALTFSPMTAIAGGTSEIQRNTIGERVLGLPREPSVDRDLPFRDILQNPTR